MSSWRDYSRVVEQPPDSCANSAISAESPVSGPRSPPIGTNGTNGTLPGHIRQGLELLAKAPAPRVRCPEQWPQVVADAVRLASEGWAAQALKLGWSTPDVFGAVTDNEGDPDGDGLAVKLNGRRVLAICANFVTVSDGDGDRSFIYRGNNSGAVLLWKLGRAAEKKE
jgi:hypothetical protein